MSIAVPVNKSRFAALVELSQSTGASVEELVDRAFTRFLAYENFIIEKKAEMALKASAGR